MGFADVKQILEILQKADHNEQVKAADILGCRKAREALPVLLEVVECDDSHVGCSAAIAVGDIGDRTALLGASESGTIAATGLSP